MAKKSRKLFCWVLTLFAALTMILMSSVAFAEEVIPPEESQVVDPVPVETEPIYTQAPEVYTTAAPVYTQAPEVYTTAPPVYTTAPSYDYQEYSTEYVEPITYYQAPVTEFYNQNEDYQQEVTEATDNTTSLIDTGREIDDTELNKGDWKKIASELANAQENKDTSSPFDYIKNADKATGLAAFFNSLNWALTMGILCFVLAAVCVIIFIVFTKKNNSKGKKNDSKRNSANSSADHRANTGRRSAVTDEQGYYIPKSQRSNSDYGDDFDSSANKKAAKRRSMEDTADINIPKKYRK